MNAAFRAPTRFIAFEYQWSPPTRVLLTSSHVYDHPTKRASRQLLHAFALMCPCLRANKDIRNRGKDIVLRRHEPYLLFAVFCEGVMWMYESRLNDFLSAVRGGQAMLRDARGEAGRAECGQKGDVEPRVEASVV